MFLSACRFIKLSAALVMVFISKFRATTSFMARTPISLLMQGMIGDLHQLHVYCGWTVLICSTIHSMFHVLRWASQGNIYLLYHHVTGFTGTIIATSTLFVCLPMTIFKENIKYEVRKYAHYLFVVVAFCLAYHTSPKSIPNGGFSAYVFSILLVWWLLDVLYCTFALTEKIETSQFEVLRNNSGVQLTMKVSEEFRQRSKNQGGMYCYVLFPFVSGNEWHAFSLFENPTNPNERQIFLKCNGDWTTQVYKTLQERDTNRPIWLQGPYPSPYNHAVSYDAQLLVASGIGVTPALSVIRAHKDTSRRINLVWTVRDKALLEFFLRHLYLDNSGWNLIFYTGSEPLDEEQIEIFSNTNICIIYGRPNLQRIIPNIIYGIESKMGFPENYSPVRKAQTSKYLAKMLVNESHSNHDSGCHDDDNDGTLLSSVTIARVEGAASVRGFDIVGLQKKTCSSESHPSGQRRNCDDKVRRDRKNPIKCSSEVINANLRIGYKPWESQGHRQCEINDFVKNLDRMAVLSTWGVLYCGGSITIQRELKQISKEYRLDLHVESFKW